jgi:hypothetical protein
MDKDERDKKLRKLAEDLRRVMQRVDARQNEPRQDESGFTGWEDSLGTEVLAIFKQAQAELDNEKD